MTRKNATSTRFKRVIACGALALAGCSVPGLGTVSPPPVPKTAVESPLISPACRADLEAAPNGPDLLNATDVALGWDAAENDAAQQATDLADLGASAAALGVTSCP